MGLKVRSDAAAAVLEALRKQDREIADKMIESWQLMVGPETHVMRLTEAWGSRLMVYGRVLDILESERLHYDLTCPEEQQAFEAVKVQYGPEWQASFVFGKWYSQLCREGEYGSVHRCLLTATITPVEFGHSRELGWPMDYLTLIRAIHRRVQH